MDSLEHIYQRNISLLTSLGIHYTEWKHEPILDFDTDVKVAQRLGWTGTHSKSLFMKIKGGGYALYLTDKDTRLDSKAMKELLGKRVSIVSDEEMTQAIGCVPGAVCPFALPKEIPIIVDSRLFTHQELLYTPGHPEVTIGFVGNRLPILLDALPNPIIEMHSDLAALS